MSPGRRVLSHKDYTVASGPVDGEFGARRLAIAGVPRDRLDELEDRLVLRTGIGLARRVPQEWARGVCVPTFLYQVRGDVLTEPSDVQAMFDNIPVADKKLQWIDGTTARWDGYL